METIDNGSILNYRRVGFGSLRMDHNMVPLKWLGVCGSPRLGLDSQWIRSFYSVCWLFSLNSAQWVKATARLTKVWICCFHSIVFCFVAHSSFILLIPRCLVVAGNKVDEEQHSSELRN